MPTFCTRVFILTIIILAFATNGAAQLFATDAQEKTVVGGDTVYMFSSWDNARVIATADTTASIEWLTFSESTEDFSLSIRTAKNVETDTFTLSDNIGLMAKITVAGTADEYRCWCFVPEIDSVNLVIDSITCDGLYARSQAYGDAMQPFDMTTSSYSPIEQEFTYLWYIGDTLTLTTELDSVELDSPMEDGELVVVAQNQALVQAGAADSVTSYGVLALFDYDAREREVANEVTSSTAYSAPAEIEFTNNSKGSYTVSEWIMGTAVRLYDKSPVYSFQKTDTYQITLIVTDENSGCSSADSTLEITITDAAIDFPNVFTPNGDGVNDEFRPAYQSIKSYKLTIMNRWGRKIYESTDPSTGWDGTIGSSDAAAGVYYYVAEADGYDKGVSFKCKGSVTLVR